MIHYEDIKWEITDTYPDSHIVLTIERKDGEMIRFIRESFGEIIVDEERVVELCADWNDSIKEVIADFLEKTDEYDIKALERIMEKVR